MVMFLVSAGETRTVPLPDMSERLGGRSGFSVVLVNVFVAPFINLLGTNKSNDIPSPSDRSSR